MNSPRPQSRIKKIVTPALGAPVTDDRHLDQWTQNARERIEKLEEADLAAQIKALATRITAAAAATSAVAESMPVDSEPDLNVLLAQVQVALGRLSDLEARIVALETAASMTFTIGPIHGSQPS